MAIVTKKIKLQLPAGKATPAPPVGTVLGPAGINIGQFVSQFNEATKEKIGSIIPVDLSVYDDRSFSFVLKTSPASALLKKYAGAAKGAANPLKDKMGKVTKAQLREIAEKKMVDLNANDVLAAEKIISGTARSMGIEIVD